MRLVVTTDTIPNCNKVKVFRIKNIAMLTGDLQESLCEPIVVLFLFGGVVHIRMFEVFITVGNQESLKLKDQARKNRISEKYNIAKLKNNQTGDTYLRIVLP